MTPNLPAAPFAYGGAIVATLGSGDSLRRPFALCKAPKLRIVPDSLISSINLFQGAASPTLMFPYSSAPLEKLVPAGTYDFVFKFEDFATFPPSPRLVVREKVEVGSFTELTVSSTEAKNKLELHAIDEQGRPLTAGFALFHYALLHRASQFTIGVGLGGFPHDQANSCFVSDVSDAFQWDATLGSLPSDHLTPIYTFNGALHHGITGSRSFTFKPSDLQKTVIVHPALPGHNQLSLTNWVSTVWLNNGSSGVGSTTPLAAAPLEQTAYSVASNEPDSAGGFWGSDAIGESSTGNLPPPRTDALYKSVLFRPTAKNLTEGRDAMGERVYCDGAKRIRLGQGPAYWSGSMDNLPGTIRIQTAIGNLIDQKLFRGQCQEELVHGLLHYTLTQHGRPIEAGTMDSAMEFFPYWTKQYVAELNVTPGAYEMTVPFSGFFLRGTPGQLEVVSKFDTTRSDPNPPSLTSFQLTNPLDFAKRDPFLDSIPATGAELRFGVTDDVQVKDACLSFQQGSSWITLPIRKTDAEHYAAYVPWLGWNRPAITLRLVARDASGNSLTLTESIPCLKR